MTALDASVTAKIEKLLAQANHPNTGAAEAAVFAAAAERLMLKHSIDESMLAAAGGHASDIVDRVFTITGQYASTRITLLVALATANRCKIINVQGTYHLVGVTSTLDTVATMFASLQTQMGNHLRKATPSNNVRGAALVSWRKQYLFGWVAQVNQRLIEQRKLAEQDATAEHGPGVGLVLVDEAKRVQAKTVELYPRLGKGRKRTSRGSFGGRAEGQRDGARADIGNKRIGGGPLALGGGR